jgi:hypothetical protein
MTEVVNLSSLDTMSFDLPPREAVIAAFEYGRGNMNTWDYPDPHQHPSFTEGAWTVACGDWCAMKAPAEAIQ